MRTHIRKYSVLLVVVLLLMEVGAARLLWIRHEQRQYTLAQHSQAHVQQQRTAQAQAERLQLAIRMLQRKKALMQQPQYALNHLLVTAMKDHDVKQALALVEAGADPNTDMSVAGENAFMIACGQYREDIPDGHYARENLFPEDISLLRAMLAHGVNLHKSSKIQNTAFDSAVELNRLHTVELLLAHGAEVNKKTDNGQTPLMVAARCAYVPMLRLLLIHGAHVNLADKEGYTPLMWGVLGDNSDVVHLLLSQGAKVNSQDDGGRSPLHFAVRYGKDRNIVRQLLGYGADPHQTRKDGMTPLGMAQVDNCPALVAILSKYSKHR